LVQLTWSVFFFFKLFFLKKKIVVLSWVLE
jgi:hypothetical protein